MNAGAVDVLAMLGDSAAAYCTRALQHTRLRRLRGASPVFERERWREMAELGWPSALIPEALGGLGLGVGAAATVCRQLGRVAAPEPMLETGVVAASLLAAADGASTLIAALISGERTYSHPLPERGCDPFTQANATPDGTGFVLNGRTAPVPLGADVDAILLPATAQNEPLLFDVPLDLTRCDVRARTLADGSRDARVYFTGVRCGQASLVARGARAHDAFTRAMALGRLASAAYLLGIADTLLDMTLEYVRTRRQFGQAIGSFQVIQHRLVDIHLHVRLTEVAVTESVAACEADQRTARWIESASCARYRACETAMLAIREAVQLHGALGFTDECDVALYLNRALVLIARYGNAAEHIETLSHCERARDAVSTPAVTATLVDSDALPPGGDWNTWDDDTFRAVVRGWTERHYPGALRHLPNQVRWADIKGWHERLRRRGWAAPAWPVEHGGMGLSADKMLIFIEEMERWGVARAPDQGIVMVGPVLLRYGTAEQRRHFLPAALSGEHIWCQGYSEPDAGSDLAALRTSAVRDGDSFVVNGQKTWTTHALDATHMYCLVRTDAAAQPQAGISFLLIDLDVPGITIRPIRNLAGEEEFCEVFLDQVRVPAANLVGRLNEGWTIAKALLGFERLFVGSPKQSQHALLQLRELAIATRQADAPAFRDRLVRLECDVNDLEGLYKQFADTIRRGETLGPDVALLKIWATETYARISELMLTVAGDSGAVRGSRAVGNVDVLSHYYNARPAPIYAGSNEIQRNIIARRVLQLPSS